MNGRAPAMTPVSYPKASAPIVTTTTIVVISLFASLRVLILLAAILRLRSQKNSAPKCAPGFTA